MEEMSKHGKRGLAALKAGMDRKTARKYLKPEPNTKGPAQPASEEVVLH